jgi:hypothetical protein
MPETFESWVHQHKEHWERTELLKVKELSLVQV